MRARNIHLVIAVPLVSLLSLAACVGGPTKSPNFYTLVPETGVTQRTIAVEQQLNPALAVGPVLLPEHLQRPQIVTRSENAQLQIAEFERWAGSLKSQIETVLVMNLSAELEDFAVTGYRKSFTDPVYRVAIEVAELLGRLGGTLDFSASWVLTDSTGEEKTRTLFNSQIQIPVEGPDYRALVAAHQEAIKTLSQQIAAAVQQQ
ncbi:MAG: PqiC family protein [Chromatiaceae bacterium]|jgi:hypothetical protein